MAAVRATPPTQYQEGADADDTVAAAAEDELDACVVRQARASKRAHPDASIAGARVKVSAVTAVLTFCTMVSTSARAPQPVSRTEHTKQQVLTDYPSVCCLKPEGE